MGEPSTSALLVFFPYCMDISILERLTIYHCQSDQIKVRTICIHFLTEIQI